MQKNMTRIITIILLLAFLFLVAVVPISMHIIATDIAIAFLIVQMVYLIIFAIAFCVFIEIVLFTRKLE